MRIPDKNYKPPVKLVLALTVGIVVVIAGVTYHNYQVHQDDLARARIMSTSSPSALAATGPSAAPSTTPASTRSVLETLKHQDDIELVMRRGWDLINKRDAKSAEIAAEIFREALRDIDSNSAQFYNGLGRASLIVSKPNDALNAFQKGLAIDPSIADMQSGIGWAYWQLHDPYHAKLAWEAALKLDPKSPDAWSAMAWIYLALGQNAQAKNGFIILVARNSSDNYAVQGLSMSRSAVQADLQQIRKFFPLPPLEYFNTPTTETAPATQP